MPWYPRVHVAIKRALPPRWHAAVAAWGCANFLSLARALVDMFHDLPLPWLTASQ